MEKLRGVQGDAQGFRGECAYAGSSKDSREVRTTPLRRLIR